MFVLCTLLLCWTCLSASRFQEFTMITRDHVCTGDDVILRFEAYSRISCVLQCVLNQSCLGCFFHSGDSACVLCDKTYENTTDLISEIGMQYYRQKGEWNDWMDWGSCSQTCGGGTQTRTRNCTSPPCTSGSSIETTSCHNFSCASPHEQTCAQWAALGLNESCYADIDPDGPGTQFSNVSVYCDFDMEPDKVITVVHHDQETLTHVHGFEECGNHTANLTYSVGFEAAIAIADASMECKQYVRYECKDAEIYNCTFWRNRNQEQSTYITGPHPGGSRCDCGETGTCNTSYRECNCDNNENFWQYDDGYATNKSDLPIFSFHASDTGRWWEEAYFVIGPLLCWDN